MSKEPSDFLTDPPFEICTVLDKQGALQACARIRAHLQGLSTAGQPQVLGLAVKLNEGIIGSRNQDHVARLLLCTYTPPSSPEGGRHGDGGTGGGQGGEQHPTSSDACGHAQVYSFLMGNLTNARNSSRLAPVADNTISPLVHLLTDPSITFVASFMETARRALYNSYGIRMGGDGSNSAALKLVDIHQLAQRYLVPNRILAVSTLVPAVLQLCYTGHHDRTSLLPDWGAVQLPLAASARAGKEVAACVRLYAALTGESFDRSSAVKRLPPPIPRARARAHADSEEAVAEQEAPGSNGSPSRTGTQAMDQDPPDRDRETADAQADPTAASGRGPVPPRASSDPAANQDGDDAAFSDDDFAAAAAAAARDMGQPLPDSSAANGTGAANGAAPARAPIRPVIMRQVVRNVADGRHPRLTLHWRLYRPTRLS